MDIYGVLKCFAIDRSLQIADRYPAKKNGEQADQVRQDEIGDNNNISVEKCYKFPFFISDTA